MQLDCLAHCIYTSQLSRHIWAACSFSTCYGFCNLIGVFSFSGKDFLAGVGYCIASFCCPQGFTLHYSREHLKS